MRSASQINPSQQQPRSCGIDYAMGRFPTFRVGHKQKNSGIDIVHFPNGYWEVRSAEFPSFDDLDVFLGVLKLFEDMSKDVYDAGTLATNVEGKGEVLVTAKGIRVSQRKLCEYCGKTPSSRNIAFIKAALIRMRSTTIFEYRGEDTRSWNLIAGLSWGNTATTSYRDKRFEICLDANYHNIINQRNHRVRWRCIQELGKQVEKGLLLFLDCNNFRNSMAFPEEWLFRFLFRAEPPELKNRPGATATQIQRAVRAYESKMRSYREKCRDFRRQINNAFDILKAKSLIYDHRRMETGKNHGWLVFRPFKRKDETL